MAKWIKSKRTGVRWREHPTRAHGAKPDRYFTIFYKLNGKMVQEALGWASEKAGQKKRRQIKEAISSKNIKPIERKNP